MGQVCDKTTKAGKTASVHLQTRTPTRTHTHTDSNASRDRLRDKREDECVTLEVKSRQTNGWRRRGNQSKSCKIKPSEYILKIMQSQGGGGCDKRM